MKIKQFTIQYICNTFFCLNIINYYIKNIYNYIIVFFKNSNKNLNKNSNKNIHNEIYLYLNDIAHKWKSNDIKNINLISDIVYIYNKYNDNSNFLINSNSICKNYNDIQEQDMKYYTLGWYMYQNILSHKKDYITDNVLENN